MATPEPGGPLLPDAVRGALVTGAVLGIVAALVVWWLERFELNRLHAEVRDYLDNVEAFRAWSREHGKGDG